jgi:hypothetical protein
MGYDTLNPAGPIRPGSGYIPGTGPGGTFGTVVPPEDMHSYYAGQAAVAVRAGPISTVMAVVSLAAGGGKRDQAIAAGRGGVLDTLLSMRFAPLAAARQLRPRSFVDRALERSGGGSGSMHLLSIAQVPRLNDAWVQALRTAGARGRDNAYTRAMGQLDATNARAAYDVVAEEFRRIIGLDGADWNIHHWNSVRSHPQYALDARNLFPTTNFLEDGARQGQHPLVHRLTRYGHPYWSRTRLGAELYLDRPKTVLVGDPYLYIPRMIR